MQKFTRPLTREIEVAGERLALTLTDQGISVRLVGSRKAPWEYSWATVLYQAVNQALEPTPEQMTSVLELVRKGRSAEPAAPATQASQPEPEPTPSPPAEELFSTSNATAPDVRPPQNAELTP